MRGRKLYWAIILAAAFVAAACAVMNPGPKPVAMPVPADNPMTLAKIELGRRLFYDADLSIDGTMSCATCHEQKKAFADGSPTHPGVRSDPGERNVMALANVGRFNSLTWGGPQVIGLEHQALLPIQGTTPIEMGFGGRGEDALPARLRDQACYPKLFAAAFPEAKGQISLDTITQALAAFQRTLVSEDAPYDRYLKGDAAAISAEAKRGEALFKSKQCASCHAGPYFTDAALPGKPITDTFHALAPLKPGDPPAADPGMARVTLKREDAGKFRTPSLRNVSLSAPYMHDGSKKTLADAIRFHFAAADRQTDARLKQTVTDAEIADLIAFLGALTDQTFITNPALALPKPGCPIPVSAAQSAEEANAAKLHNNLPGP